MKRDAKAMDAYLHDLLDCMPDAMLVVNSSGTITLVVTNCIYPQLKPQLSGFSEPH